MLQRGVETNGLDVAYVSSLSLYFMMFFGLRGVFSLILGENPDTDDAKVMQQQMQGGGMQRQDMKKLFESEKDQLVLVDWTDGTAICAANTDKILSLKSA